MVHLILQAWNMARWRKQEFQLEKFKKLFEEGWKDQPPGIKWDGEEAGEKNTAWSVLEMYFAQTPIKANEMPEAVEVPMETDLSKYGLPTLIGVLDLVRAGGRIVDFKSTGKTPDRRRCSSPERNPIVLLLGPVSRSNRALGIRKGTASPGQNEDAEAGHHGAGANDRHAAGQVVPHDGVVCRGVGQGRLRSITWFPLRRL